MGGWLVGHHEHASPRTAGLLPARPSAFAPNPKAAPRHRHYAATPSPFPPCLPCLQGGGTGFLGRQHGLGCDQVLALEMVDAEGQVVRASATENPDLLAASCGGGGGNFGTPRLLYCGTMHGAGTLLVWIVLPGTLSPPPALLLLQASLHSSR